ncbi:MAG: endopeptidase La [Burkholderiales bacterium]
MEHERKAEQASPDHDIVATHEAPGEGVVPAPALPDDALLIIPVRNVVLFPGMAVPIGIGRPRSIAAAKAATENDRQVGIILQRNPQADVPTAAELFDVGTAANIVRYLTAADGARHLICQGDKRFRVVSLIEGFPYYVARVEWLRDAAAEADSSEVEARFIQLRQRAVEILELLPQTPAELSVAIQTISSASALADFVTGLMDLKPTEKQDVLETLPLRSRLDKVLGFLDRRIEVLRLSQEIGAQTKERLEGRQRENLLREQMKTIQKELGEIEGAEAEIGELAAAITKAQMPAEVDTHAKKELKRLERMSEQSGEHSMLRTYLEWLTELPWTVPPEDRIDIHEARRILDEDHFGLEKIKRRILEHLSVRKLNPQGRSPILCFIGPPGVGKTSLGQSIARAMNRKFARVSLGGVHDEAEIRGHRRTYVGALPGNIIQAIRKAGARNCVLMLDELDKLGRGIHGDPSSALLEVLDPEQNATFRDNYLGVPFDLSRVMFIGTANMLDTIHGPLRDRMEIIHLPGYTAEEKAQIAGRFLIRRQLEANGLASEQCVITDDAVRTLILDYTREAGVRNLEREIGAVFRHAAMRIAEGSMQGVRVDAADLEAILGPRKFESELAMRTSLPGVSTGLAWTPVGGDILFIEATRTPGTGKLILTGQLGDVMKESAQTALTLVKARCVECKVAPEFFEKGDIHVHVPAGAIPKDGPSAGVAMFLALASLTMNRPVRNDRAMTGEVSLRGLVLPVGGIKEKVLAALRAGIQTVLLPARNKKELQDIPEDAKQQLQVIWLETVEDALHAALTEEKMTA